MDDFNATPAEIAAARRAYEGCGECIQIDDDAQASRGDDGTWVQAWVLIRNQEQ